MARRFKIPAIPTGEVARYVTNPYETNIAAWGYAGWDGTGTKDMMVRPNDELLVQKGGVEAFNVYQKLLFDETVQAALIKMSQEITARPWKLEPAAEKPGDIAVRDFVENQLKRLQIDEIYRGLLEAYVVGYTVGEVMWRRTAAGVVPFDFRFRDQRRFRFQEEEDADYGFTMRMATREKPWVGEELPPRKFCVFRYWAHNNGDPYGAGLGRILYPLVKFKRRALESQLLYSDRFSNPTAVAKAPLSATANEVDTLYDHLSNLSQETALVLPEGFELEFVTPGGSPETFQNLRETLARSIQILIAGEDEAGMVDAGSRASAEVAQTVRMARAKDLSELISNTLNDSIIRWIVDLNFGTNVEAPQLYRDFDPVEDVQLSMQDVATLVKDIGLRPSVEWLTERFSVELEEDDKVIPMGPEKTSGVDVPGDPMGGMGGPQAGGAQQPGSVDGLIDSILGPAPESGGSIEAPTDTTPTGGGKDPGNVGDVTGKVDATAAGAPRSKSDEEIDSLIDEVLG